MASTLSERSGVIDLGLEGKMLAAAFAAASVAATSGSLLLALAAAVAVGVALSMLHAFACVSHDGDQVVTGMAITMTAAGLTAVLGIAWFNQGGQTPPVPDAARLDPWFVSAADAVARVPGFGPVIGGGLLGHTALVYLAIALVGVQWWWLYRTRAGLRVRATGENPSMVDAAGVSVHGLRYLALAGNGVLTALAGCDLVLALNPQFIPNMTAGRGYMAMAAMIFGKWHPFGAFLSCLLFGFLDALSIRLQGTLLPAVLGGGAVPVQAIQALPYVLTVVLLAGFIGHAYAPKALGIAYVKER
jgi:simple sugar transport system permease protein